MLILIDTQYRCNSRPSYLEVVFFGKLLDIHVDSALLEVILFEIGLMLSRKVVPLSTNHHVVLLTRLGLAQMHVLRYCETES